MYGRMLPMSDYMCYTIQSSVMDLHVLYII